MLLISLLLSVFSGCRKSAFLDVVPDHKLLVPSSLDDYERLLRSAVLNGTTGNGLIPSFMEGAADDYYITAFPTTMAAESLKKLYVWDDDLYSVRHYQWSYPYQAVFYANTVLEGLEKLTPGATQLARYHDLQGQAFFHRAHLFYQLAQVFAPAYLPERRETHYGLPLRLSADVNEQLKRATLGETYDQIIRDARLAARQLLPDASRNAIPGKAAAYALLARIHWSMNDHPAAMAYADSCLQLKSDLLNYADINPVPASPFQRLNKEVIFHALQVFTGTNALFLNSRCRIADGLVSLYKPGDLRKALFFRAETGGYSFRGSYDGTTALFHGITVPEVILIAAEGAVRTGNTEQAGELLHTLLLHRHLPGSVMPVGIGDADALLQQILEERRRELVFRGLRWTDLRRLNAAGAGITLHRSLEGIDYQLPPGDPHWTFLVPPDVMDFHPDMPQNER